MLSLLTDKSLWHCWQFTANAVDTGGKFTTSDTAGSVYLGKNMNTGINDIGGKFAAGVIDAGGQFAFGVTDTDTLSWEYLCEFSKKFEIALR